MEVLPNLPKTQAKEMRIIAIDPGSTESAYIILDTLPRVENKIVEHKKVANGELVDLLRFYINNSDEHWRTFELVIEQIASYGMAVGEEVFETVFWSGRFAQAWPGKFYRLKRHEIKMHLCHDSRAKDCNIRQALIDRYGKQGTKKNRGPTYGISGDCWSALAVATTFADKQQIEPRKEE